MRLFILDIVARVLGFHIKVGDISYGRPSMAATED
jgi:hypothetical protein